MRDDIAQALADARLPPRRRATQHPEEALQVAILARFRMISPKTYVAHIPNGGRRSKSEACRLKASGVRRGVPDLMVITPWGVVGFVEVKTKRGSLSPDQQAFRQMCLDRNVHWACLRSADQVETVLVRWGAISPRGRSPLAVDFGHRDVAGRSTYEIGL